MSDNLFSFLHVILLLVMALITFLIKMSNKSLDERINKLEILLEKFTAVIDEETL